MHALVIQRVPVEDVFEEVKNLVSVVVGVIGSGVVACRVALLANHGAWQSSLIIAVSCRVDSTVERLLCVHGLRLLLLLLGHPHGWLMSNSTMCDGVVVAMLKGP